MPQSGHRLAEKEIKMYEEEIVKLARQRDKALVRVRTLEESLEQEVEGRRGRGVLQKNQKDSPGDNGTCRNSDWLLSFQRKEWNICAGGKAEVRRRR